MLSRHLPKPLLRAMSQAGPVNVLRAELEFGNIMAGWGRVKESFTVQAFRDLIFVYFLLLKLKGTCCR